MTVSRITAHVSLPVEIFTIMHIIETLVHEVCPVLSAILKDVITGDRIEIMTTNETWKQVHRTLQWIASTSPGLARE